MKMAKKEKTKFNYGLEVRQLKEKGPERLYLMYGEEDYLRERFLDELKKICLSDEADFNYKRLDGPSIDMNRLAEAVDAIPFFSERSFVEIRGFDVNKCRDSDCERLKTIISDIPDYCTVAVIIGSDYELDGRLAAVKAIKKYGRSIEFTAQDQDALTRWIANRFGAYNKSISRQDAEYLTFVGGTLMNRLIPEIEKIASHSNAPAVTRADIDAVAHRIPEADVFEMTDMLSQGKIDAAASLLSALLADKDNAPIYLLAIFAQQIRRMYAFKLAQSKGKGKPAIMELVGLRFDFLYNKLSSCAKPYSIEALKNLVELCVEYDFKMKSTGIDNVVLMKELLIKVAVSGK